MGELIWTEDTPFDLRSWAKMSIYKVFAGHDCIMAITTDGHTLQLIADESLAARTEYWTRIQQISLSSCISGLAIGRVADGTCLVTKRPLRRVCKQERECHRDIPFSSINDNIKSWNNLTQVLASDAFFGLDTQGYVHVAPLDTFNINGYSPAAHWTGVKRIVAGTQHSLLGITEEGRVLCTGYNLLEGAHSDIREQVSLLRDVVDIAVTGGECEDLFFAFRDGSVKNYLGNTIQVTASIDPNAGAHPVFAMAFNYTVCLLNQERKLRVINNLSALPVFNPDVPIASFAVGDCGFGKPFIIAVTE